MCMPFGKVLKTTAVGAGLLLAAQVADAAVITFDPLNHNVLEGSSFTMTLVGQDFTAGVNGALTDGSLGGGVDISWDPLVITLANLGDVNLVFPGDMLFAPAPSLDTVAGTLRLSFGSFNGASVTDFDLAELTFSASAIGDTAVTVAEAPGDVWTDGEGDVNVFPTYIDGMVSVSAVPLPASLLLLGSGLFGLVAVGRSRSVR